MAQKANSKHTWLILFILALSALVVSLAIYLAIAMINSKQDGGVVSDGSINLPELGVKLSFVDIPTDLYYVSSDNSADELKFSTETIKSIDAQCGAETNPVFYLNSSANPDAAAFGESNPPGPTIAQAYPNGFTINGKYYYLRASNGPCSKNAEAVKAQQELVDKIKSATIEKL